MRSAESWAARPTLPRFSSACSTAARDPRSGLRARNAIADCIGGRFARCSRNTTGVETIQGTVARLIIDEASASVAGVETLEGRRFGARSVVITTGTFLRGRIHIGTETKIAGGRAGESSATHLAEQLERLGLVVERFKTGTPPRIDGRSVDFSSLERQDSEIDAFDYSWSHFWPSPRRTSDRTRHPEQIPCWITFLGEEGKGIIDENIARSAMYGGAIASRGPRYCPSVEDKIVKFPARGAAPALSRAGGPRHRQSCTSTDCRRRCRRQFNSRSFGRYRVSSKRRMTRAGYAIEYDYYPPTQLDASLQVQRAARTVFRRPDQRHDGLRRGRGAGCRRGLECRPPRAWRAPR